MKALTWFIGFVCVVSCFSMFILNRPMKYEVFNDETQEYEWKVKEFHLDPFLKGLEMSDFSFLEKAIYADVSGNMPKWLGAIVNFMYMPVRMVLTLLNFAVGVFWWLIQVLSSVLLV